MATHSSVLAWRIPGTGEPGGLPSMGLHRVGHDWSDLAVAAASFSLEKAMATHSSTLAWRIPWTEEPGRLQSMGSLRAGHDWATSLSHFTFHFHALEKEWQPTPVFLPGESQGQESLVGYGVTQSWTWLTRLSSSSSSKLQFAILKKFSNCLHQGLPQVFCLWRGRYIF